MNNDAIYYLSPNDHSEDKRAYWYRGVLWFMLATEDDTAGQYALIEQLCPQGPVAAPHLHEWQEENPPRFIREQVEPQIPLGRLGEPEDIADIVAFLCSHDGRWITAQTIRATGGLV